MAGRAAAASRADPAAAVGVGASLPLRLPTGLAVGVALCLLGVAACRTEISERTRYHEAEAEFRRGSLDRALQQVRPVFEQYRTQESSEWHREYRELYARVLLARLSAMEARKLLEGVRAPEGRLEAWRLIYLADAERHLGQTEASGRLLGEAERLAKGLPELLPAIQLRRGYLAKEPAQREAWFQRALASATEHGDHQVAASALNDLALVRVERNRYDEALPFLERAQESARRGGVRRLEGLVAGSLGWCYYRLGDQDRALGLFTQAEGISRETCDVDRRHRWLNNLGNIYFDREDYRQAATYYQEAAELARRVQNLRWLAITLNNLTEVHVQAGDLAAAEAVNQQARELTRRTGNTESFLYAQLRAARVAERRSRTGEAERLFRAVLESAGAEVQPIVVWEAHSGVARCRRAAGGWQEADAAYRRALDLIETERSKLGEEEHQVTFLAQLMRFYQDYVDFLVERGESDRALEMAEHSRARVLARRLDQGTLESWAVRAAELPALARSANTVFLSYWLAAGRSFVWTISAGGITRADLPDAGRIASLVERYTAAVVNLQDPLARENPHGTALYELLVRPVAARLPRGASVIVIPDGPLYSLNFETLVAPEPAPHYWIEDATVSVAPSLAVLAGSTSGRRDGARELRLLFIGDPRPPDPGLPALPSLRLERDMVGRFFPAGTSRILTGEAAHPAAYRESRPDQFTHLHFAAHAVANSESPLYSAVLLSPKNGQYKLFARDVLEAPLRASLVTLSACYGAGSKTYSGEGLIGFAWAFLRAGARNVVAGLWQADDEATARLVEQLYAGMAAGRSPAESLRQAKLAIIGSGGFQRRPYFWGTLELFAGEVGAPTIPARPGSHPPAE